MKLDISLIIDNFEDMKGLLDMLRSRPPVVNSLEATISEEVYRDFQETVDEALNRHATEISQLKLESNVLRGALDETITQVRQAQAAAREVEPKGNGKRQPMVRGIYCRFCGKELDTKTGQRIFCSQGCAGRWAGQHKGEKPTPRLTLKDEKLGTTVVAGEGVRA